MTNALAYTDTINKLPRRTAQVPARRPGITTTGFSTGKKLPHNGAMKYEKIWTNNATAKHYVAL